MPIYPSSSDTDLGELIKNRVATGKVQLPEFQRDWTWDDARIRGIIASIIQCFPMGAIMLLQCGNPAIKFKCRPVEGVEAAGVEPETLILDGQQRLTSIYLATYSEKPVKTKNDVGSPIERYYYLSIPECAKPELDEEKAIVAVPGDKKVKGAFNRDVILDVSTREKEIEAKLFPLNIVFKSDQCMSWIFEYIERYKGDDAAAKLIMRFKESVLDVFSNYKVPVITLDKATSREAVCKVFENVNTGGVTLTAFELITATYAADDFDLRKDWEACRAAIRDEDKDLKQTDILDGLGATDFLTAMTLYASYARKKKGLASAVSCKKKDVLDLPLAAYKESRDAVLKGFALAKRFLLQRQCVYRQRDLPYGAQIIPLAAICAALGEGKVDTPKAVAVLSQWYWCGILGEMYGSANETRFAADIEDVLARVDGDPDGEIRTVNAAAFSSTRLLSLQTRNSAAYKGLIALLYKAGCRDFMNGLAISVPTCMSEQFDLHHIFPKAYCEKKGLPVRLYNSIVNKTPLLPPTNKAIGGSAPSAYLAMILQPGYGLTEGKLRAQVESHCIDYDLLKADDFHGFFIARAKALLGLIGEAMGKAVTDKGSEDTIKAFGASLEG